MDINKKVCFGKLKIQGHGNVLYISLPQYFVICYVYHRIHTRKTKSCLEFQISSGDGIKEHRRESNTKAQKEYGTLHQPTPHQRGSTTDRAEAQVRRGSAPSHRHTRSAAWQMRCMYV